MTKSNKPRHWPTRVDDHDLLVHDHGIRALAERANVRLIGFRALRDAMRGI
ncbi:MAG TPA: hypothetical protein VK988_16580 [Acidimicrobiales bacterium]|nr:hypothetical protein [Acidimicrobiales bacterium]